ncbi:MAG: hypothetical protein JSV41_01720 [Gemmatimonadota bacterium]|nr:MAG: hypothetical protein JSV41_01720 [Gemmatimonadota bacterium]
MPKVVKALKDRDVDDNRFWEALQFAARYTLKPAMYEDDDGQNLPYIVIGGPPAGIVKPEDAPAHPFQPSDEFMRQNDIRWPGSWPG